MALSRAVCAWSLVLSVAGLAAACGSDDDPGPAPAAGARDAGAGRSGSAGRGGTAGATGTGGTSGSTGTGGSAGSTGGSSGTGGADGSGGSGGTVGADASPDGAGTGGTGGGDAGPDAAGGTGGGDASPDAAGGTAGEDASPDAAGTGGTGGDDAGDGSAGDDGGDDAADDAADAATAGQCIERCTDDDDCRRNDAAVTNTACRNNRCVSLTNYCDASDAECVPVASQWTVACSTSAPCAATFVCIDIGGGVGRCALPDGAPLCTVLGLTDVIAMPRIDGSGNVDVCGDDSQFCNTATHTCSPDCTVAGCPPFTACNTTTKLCGCTANTACAARPGTPTCNTATGACECASNTDCDHPAAEGDVCVNGKCSCSSVASCIKTYDGTTETCE